MPPRARSPLPKSLQPQYPVADSATFKDLLLFEERLKRNAGLLKRRKARYQRQFHVLSFLFIANIPPFTVFLLWITRYDQFGHDIPSNSPQMDPLAYYLMLTHPRTCSISDFLAILNVFIGQSYRKSRHSSDGSMHWAQIVSIGMITNVPNPRMLELGKFLTVYLALLVSTIVILSSDVLLETVLFELPLNTALSYYYSYRYPGYKEESYACAKLSQYVKTCALFVLGMTLFLFFASGMHSEKVGYANKYVPHANKALRSFNMYLNVRTQPLPSRISRMASSLGLGFFFPPPKPTPPTVPPSPTTVTTSIPQRMRTRSLSPSFSSSSRDSGISTVPLHASSNYYASATEIIPPIPPSTNPRGELIFSSRVHAGFREQYERYRENYERKRMMGSASSAAAQANTQPRILRSWLERLRLPFVRMDSTLTNVDTTPTMTPPPDTGDGSFSPGSLRGRTITLSSTPSASRRSSPAPGTGTAGRKGSKRSRGGKVSRQGTPLLEIVEVMGRNDSSSRVIHPDQPTVTAEPAEYGAGSGDVSALVEVPSLGTGGDGGSLSSRRPGEMGTTRKRGSKGRRGSASGGFE